jgi:flagellar biosynthesis/type III secretory pathway M-ring protein FliF/YscJ
VAIKTQQFPIAAIQWIVVVIVILVVYRQFAQARTGKLASAASADPWE